MEKAEKNLEVYSPLMEYFNLGQMKKELENISFKILYPEEYEYIDNFLKTNKLENEAIIGKVQEYISAFTEYSSQKPIIYGRLKSHYSIYKKLKKYQSEKKFGINRIEDFIAFTIITDSVESCYQIVKLFDELTETIPETFEDYIQNPKPNGYRSIHFITRIPEITDQKIELQIETIEMNQFKKYGPASHIYYKQVGKRYSKATDQFSWVETLYKQMEILQSNLTIPHSVPFKVSLFENQVFVFTPANEVIELPKGATALDFAYEIHTAIGNGAIHARINDHEKPLHTELKNEDLVEIITNKAQKNPKAEWLNWVITPKAKGIIRKHLIKSRSLK